LGIKGGSYLADFGIEGVGEAYMAYYALFEEREWSYTYITTSSALIPLQALAASGRSNSTFRTINNLIWHHEIPRLNLLPQTAHSTKRNNRPDANTPQRRNICTVGYFVRRVLVVETVAGEEGDGGVVVREDVDGGGGVAPGGQWVECCDGDVAGEGLQAGAADYGD
jgi:hypothetical protein